MGAIKIEDIKQQLAEVGWEVVTPQYQNLKTEMEFKCPEGHSVYSTWGKMRTKQECPICAKNAYSQVFTELPQVPSKGKAYRVLALDQATHRTGYAIFDDNDSNVKALSLKEAKEIAKNSEFVKKHLTEAFIKDYTD